MKVKEKNSSESCFSRRLFHTVIVVLLLIFFIVLLLLVFFVLSDLGWVSIRLPVA